MNSIRLRNGAIHTFTHTEVMGIVNVTPDSFFAASRSSTEEAAAYAERLIREGAEIIDVGGESTRPGAEEVSPEEECRRVCPVIERIREKHPEILISIDTYHSETAKAAVEAGADIINDISAMEFDPKMAAVAAGLGVPIILMHTGGRPKEMQKDPQYADVVEDVRSYLRRRADQAIRWGIARDRIILDPGIGFGKNYDHNVALLQELNTFCEMGFPVLLGVSRKTVIGQMLDHADPADRLYGTIATSLHACMAGVDIVRVHDVKENAEAIRVLEILRADTLRQRWEEKKQVETTRAVIGMGSNMGDRKGYLTKALEEIEKRAGVITGRSQIIETRAYGYTEQDDFLNMVASIETALTPHELLSVLQDIEHELGRVRTIHWGPRTIDLDILYYGDEIIDDNDLHVPHPDLYNREFVLRPLAELDENYIDPRKNQTIKQLFKELMTREG